MMTRIKIEACMTISNADHSSLEQLKQTLRISQQQGLIRPTGDPSLDAPSTDEPINTEQL
tara:strand:- start:121 stop:300 length:180 start_codon:yes stop_codon:yes gene_type:complete